MSQEEDPFSIELDTQVFQAIDKSLAEDECEKDRFTIELNTQDFESIDLQMRNSECEDREILDQTGTGNNIETPKRK